MKPREKRSCESNYGWPSVACPICGKQNGDLWENGGPLDLENEPVEIECGSCGRKLTLSCRVIVTYTLTEVEPEGDDDEAP